MVSFFVKYFTCGCPDEQRSVFWLRDTGFNQALYKVTPSLSRSVQDTLLDKSNRSMLHVLMESTSSTLIPSHVGSTCEELV